jgi:hypothetical protein
MREDSIGLFWQDLAPVKERLAKPPKAKRTPPARTWEEPGYLPFLEEAREFPVEQYTPRTLQEALDANEPLLFDIEIYPNYFLAAFRGYWTGRVIYFEYAEDRPLDVPRLRWVMENFLTVGFNSDDFDIPITSMACAGKTLAELNAATHSIINLQLRPSLVLRTAKTKRLKINHIDLIEVAPLDGSLKIYGGRLHCPRMQELPFPPATTLTENQQLIVRWYCVGSDLVNTGVVFANLEEQIKLRCELSVKYGVDVRSKSDAQIAEAVIAAELRRRTGVYPERPEIEAGTAYRYNPPAYLNFQTPALQELLKDISEGYFTVKETGYLRAPDCLYDPATMHKKEEDWEYKSVVVNKRAYTVGLGGLHSQEKKQAVFSDANHVIIDRDVASYYPAIILNQKLCPEHLGLDFLEVYQDLVTRRLIAKKAGDKAQSESLKIVVNGAFGKLGSKWSVIYAPQLMVQVTITGQLSLLLLVERLELAGISVVSANTDGIVAFIHNGERERANAIYAQWEKDTGFVTEETEYLGLFSRDVNNYLAVKAKGGVKGKGAYFSPYEKKGLEIYRFHKNPVSTICIRAVEEFLEKGIDISDTIRGCRDVREFVVVRTVMGGAVQGGEYLGKAIRWYYGTGERPEMIYAKSGNLVPMSVGAVPCLDLPDGIPEDLDFEYYEREALDILRDAGYPMQDAA